MSPDIFPLPALALTLAMYALVDCNSFYCACEAVFRPDLENRPVIVLSNGDGCVIALNQKAKALGVKMGTPFFQLKPMVQKAGIAVFSSNYELYGDMSRRVMSVVSMFSPCIEEYSIDEAFLDLSGFKELPAYARNIKATVKQWTGIPVSVGVGTTKTLAKAANKYAKLYPEAEGVGVLDKTTDVAGLLSRIPVEDVWGVGDRWSKRLQAAGIKTADDLRRTDPAWISRAFNVVLERTVRELNGIPCLPLELQPSPKQQIVVARSFGSPVEDLSSLKEAVSMRMTRAAEKLRKEGLAASALHVFAHTNFFSPHASQYRGSATIQLPYPTQDSRLLVQHALVGLTRFYKPGYLYKKAGVMLLELEALQQRQGDLFDAETDHPQSRLLMNVLDSVNRKMGRGTLFLASQGIHPTPQKWHMRRELKSPRYTTAWEELPRVY